MLSMIYFTPFLNKALPLIEILSYPSSCRNSGNKTDFNIKKNMKLKPFQLYTRGTKKAQMSLK